MLITNQRLDKLAAARVGFINHSMLDPKNPQTPGMDSARLVRGDSQNEVGEEDEDDKQPDPGPTGNAQVAMVTGNVILAQTHTVVSLFWYSFADHFIDEVCSSLLSSVSGCTH